MIEENRPMSAVDAIGVYPICPERIPSVHEESSRYELRFARDLDDLRRIQRLRFEVFNLELGEGLDRSYATLRDEDHFDRTCHHMMVVDRKTRAIVGTYRMQSIEMLGEAGFYSAAQFDLATLERSFLPSAVELGRACIGREHRTSRVLFLLWRGLAAYMLHNKKRYFFGCCSLTSQDAAEGLRMLAYLEANDFLDPNWRVVPQTGYECIATIGAADDCPPVPQLMRTYLQYGARIAGPPAIDRLFKTIDFLTVFDIESIDDRIRRIFLE